MRSIKLAAVFTLLCASLGWMPARAAAPAVFQVGFGTRIVDPARPQYLGGFGFGAPVQNLLTPEDHMEVRAIAIAQGTSVVEMAIVDTQGYFAGNQEGPWGSREARLEAAKQIAALGAFPAVTDANIVVSSTHSHAAPTIMGIWGPTDPQYLKQVYEGTVGALVDAAKNMRAANLYAGTADVAPSIVSAVTQTDGYQGWPPDGRVPVLQARDPDTGATLGLYANVPVHADIVDGVDDHVISADHIGFERRALDAQLGGTSVVAMGTLGRQESIIQVQGPAHAQALASYVTNVIEQAIASARPLTDPTVAAAQQYLLVPATNPALAGLNTLNRAGDIAGAQTGDQVGTHCIPGVDICSIDRESLPPYAVGGAFGAWFTALRIGDLMYASEPGEAFTEVSDAIRASIPGVDVRVIGMAQDQLGYYFPPETIPWTAFNNSDHHIYNSSLLLGEFNVQAQAQNAQALGFATQFVHKTSEFDDTVAAQHAGVQFFPLKTESANRTFRFDARRSGSAFGNLTQGNGWTDSFGGAISWEWGDGTSSVQTGDKFIDHTFGRTGPFTVRASVTDPRDGHVATFQVPVRVDAPLEASVREYEDQLSVRFEGGSGSLISARWTFDDDTVQITDGYHAVSPNGRHGTVEILDGAGNTAKESF